MIYHLPISEHLVLSAKDVHKTYRLGDIEVQAIRSVNLSIKEGSFLAIAGRSGSGKTTLLNLFGCLDKPTSGLISVDGVGTNGMTKNELANFRARKLGFIFQTFNLLPVLTAIENVEYPLLILKRPRRESYELAKQALIKVGLEKLIHHRPDQLSGGQRQRVAIARALVKNPRTILADEPTANLDRATAVEIVDLLRKLNTNEKVTIVFSTHDPMILERVDSIFEMNEGKEDRRIDERRKEELP